MANNGRKQPQLQSNSQPKILVQQTRTVTSYSGPVPDVESIERYTKIDPGFAQFFMNQAIKEQDHRHHCDRETIEEVSRARRGENQVKIFGQSCAVLVIGMVVGLSVYLASIGEVEQTSGILKATGAVIGSMVIFTGYTFYKKRQKQDAQASPEK